MTAHALHLATPAPTEEVRARAKTLTSRPAIDVEGMLERALNAAGISKRQLGPVTRDRDGRPLSQALGFKWLDRSQTTSLPRLDHVATWPASLRAAIAAELVSAVRPAADLMRGALVAGREAGEASGAVLEAVADGNVNLREAERVAREAWEAVAAFRALALAAEAEVARLKGEK